MADIDAIPESGPDAMITDQDQVQETQETQELQETQPVSQEYSYARDPELWGFFQPCNPAGGFNAVLFLKENSVYKIGRHASNHVLLPGFKISNFHATVQWDGKNNKESCVLLRDLSSNGTFVNGHKVGKGNTRILREGNEVAFGTLQSAKADEDYRFIFRHLGSGIPTEGLYAQYDISSELGKGSFATVLKAICRQTGEWVAIKMIQESRRTGRDPTSEGDGARNTQKTNIAREIDIMKSLEHPNICKLKDVFYMDNNDISLVLELVEGGDLLEYILKRHGLSEEISKHITYQLCQALAYVHGEGVAHRDLKPENVLLTKDDPPNVKVADFGLAKVNDSLTMLKTMCGTPAYLAPEVVRQENQEGYDNLVDSWSVGVILFSMLTNSSPFIEDETQRDIRARIATRKIDWDTLERVEVTQECEDFVRRLLDDDPNTRMTLKASLEHPWLLSYTPLPNASGSGSSFGSQGQGLTVDVSMADDETSQQQDDQSESSSNLVSQGFENMKLDPRQAPNGGAATTAVGAAAGAGPGPSSQQSNDANGSTTSIPGLAKTPPKEDRRPLGREVSRMLQRRAHVLDNAEENGQVVPEPSPEMITKAAREEQRRREQVVNGDENGDAQPGSSGSDPNSKGKGKRLRQEVSSSLSDLEDDESGEASPASEVGKDRDVLMEGTPAKKGRTMRGPSSEPTPTQRRGRGSSTAGRGGGRGKGKGKLTDISEETANKDGPPLRRSGRHGAKNAN
ncbi:hypothetical protein VKT23_013601 [Stygiomarasmius scandens]|uniref:Pkinase-domain-containing protein n=1 Tax=Marasmiellus scandens TaxID=2682957 RepID=A0ABR1J2W5_9AGAR